jgi:predicted ribosome quality control (RQC) complex YloA/Tae2 family protein
MKSDLSSLELHYLLKELQELVGAKLEQLYQPGKEEFLFQLHVPSAGKQLLRVIIGKFIYLASSKSEMPESPPSFCLYLRRKLKNARLKSVSQLSFERIIEFVFETKEAEYKLMIELFSKGNVILCDNQGIILSVLEQQEWKDRILKPKQHYLYPKKEFNFLTLTKAELELLLRKSDKENLVKTLAMDLGLGGVYAEELCLASKVDKNLKSSQLSGNEISALYDSIEDVLGKKISPVVIYDDQNKDTVKDVFPFRLASFNSLPSAEFDNFSDALDSVLTKKMDTKAIEATEKTAKTKIGKIKDMISQQQARLEGLDKSDKENQRKAELIYENYIVLKELLEELNDLRKKMPWPELKAKFKGHKLVKEINENTGEMVVEL